MPDAAPYNGDTDVQAARASSGGYPGMPRWVKLGGIVALILLVLVVVVMVLGGSEHGPMRHIPSGSGPSTFIAATI